MDDFDIAFLGGYKYLRCGGGFSAKVNGQRIGALAVNGFTVAGNIEFSAMGLKIIQDKIS